MTTIGIETPATAAPRRRFFRIDTPAIMVLPGLVFMVVAFAIPVLILVADSFRDANGFTVAGYGKVLGDPYYIGITGNSLQLGLITTLGSLLIGYPAAFALSRAPPRLQVLLFALIIPAASLAYVGES